MELVKHSNSLAFRQLIIHSPMNVPVKESIEIIFNLSMLGFVSGSMIMLGLDLTIAQIIAPFKHVKIVIRALLANFLIVPLIAYGLVSVLPVSDGVRIGILLLSFGGGAPFIPMIVATAKSHVRSSVGLMVTLLLITLFFMPVVVPRVLDGTSLNFWHIARSLLVIMLLPLMLALLIKALFSDMADRIQPYARVVTTVSVIMLILTVIALYAKVIVANAHILPVITLFFLLAMTIGYLAGGKRQHARIVLAVGTGLRNPPIAILVASQNFPAEPMAAIVPLLLAVISVSILLPLAIITRKHVHK